MDRIDSTLKRKYIQPYKPDPNQSISDKNSKGLNNSDHDLSYVAKNLGEIRYDIDKSIKEAQNLFKHMEYADDHKNTNSVLFHKGTIYRSKLQKLNDSLTETISKNTASIIIKQHLNEQDNIAASNGGKANANKNSRYKKGIVQKNKLLRELGIISHEQEQRNLKA